MLNAHLILAAHLQTSGILLHYYCAPPFQPKLTIQGIRQVLALLFFPPKSKPKLKGLFYSFLYQALQHRGGQGSWMTQSHCQHWVDKLFFNGQPEEEIAETTALQHQLPNCQSQGISAAFTSFSMQICHPTPCLHFVSSTATVMAEKVHDSCLMRLYCIAPRSLSISSIALALLPQQLSSLCSGGLPSSLDAFLSNSNEQSEIPN